MGEMMSDASPFLDYVTAIKAPPPEVPRQTKADYARERKLKRDPKAKKKGIK
jgi:hypothetical protein